MVISATPDGSVGEPVGGGVGDWLTTAASNITGSVVTTAIEVHARDDERQQRARPPAHPASSRQTSSSSIILGLVSGILGWPVARSWWARIWPAEERGEYSGPVGYHAAQTVRRLVFLLVFLPFVGPWAFAASLLLQAWGVVTMPLRFVRWLNSGSAVKTG